MTRFGVVQHLRVLEAAGLVTTCRVGREKRPYLNPMPDVARGWNPVLSGLRTLLETGKPLVIGSTSDR